MAFKTTTKPGQSASGLASTRQDPLSEFELQDPLIETASNEAERQQGLKGRRDLNPGDGMLFRNDESGPQSYHMEDTPSDLDIAFADESGTVTSTDKMESNTGKAEGHGKYVLEQAAGSFARQGIDKGSQLNGVPGVDLS